MTHLMTWLRALCLSALLFATVAAAQERPNYEEWGALANRAEDVVAAGRASDSALETLRADVAQYRERFLQAQSINAERIQTLRSQIDALGPAPAEGETEPDEIAERRAELNRQLSELRAPVIRAEEAYSRADGLIREIDNTIRERQTDEILELRPSPINPTLWPAAVEQLYDSFAGLRSEFARNWSSDTERAELRANLPIIFGLVLLAVLLIMRGRSWVELLVQRMRSATRRGTGVWSTILSLGLIFVPLVGLQLLLQAADYTSMFGSRGSLLLDSLAIWLAVFLFVRWLADQTFSSDERVATSLLPPARRVEARFYTNTVAILLVVRGLLGGIAEQDDYSPESLAVLEFPILVACALMLFRLGQIMMRMTAETEAKTAAEAEEGGAGEVNETTQFRSRISRLLGRAAMLVAVVSPTMAAIGYVNAGEALLYPTIMTLALYGIVLVVLRFINDLYQLFTGVSVGEADSLVPVLAGFVVTLAAMPVLALIWGARVADLSELWARFREGFTFGETRISPTDFLTFAIVFAIGYALTRLLQSGLRSSVLPKTKIDVGGQNAIVSGLGYFGIFIAAIVAITSAGLDLSSLAIVAGALSVGIGFGLQNIVSNFVSGIILLIERPISEGDLIEVGGQLGTVKDISVRSTRIETFDRTDVIVPNADLVSGTVVNYTRGNLMTRIFFTVGVAYGSDTRKVQDILLSICRENDKVLLNPEPSVIFAAFGADSLNFEVRVILSNIADKLATLSELNHEINRRFAEEGIEIPFAQRDVWLRNPETLRADAKPASKPATADQPRVRDTEDASEAEERRIEGLEDEADASDGDGR